MVDLVGCGEAQPNRTDTTQAWTAGYRAATGAIRCAHWHPTGFILRGVVTFLPGHLRHDFRTRFHRLCQVIGDLYARSYAQSGCKAPSRTT